ncbi:MAG: hypothetical protein AB4426_33945 [Xenococcaceae cyanobacterium]
MTRLPPLFIAAVSGLTFCTSPVRADAVLPVTARQAQGLDGAPLTIKVWSGYGTNISFIPTGETIVRMWIDNPSVATVDTDGALCEGRSANCTPSGATVIHLRRIHNITFDTLPASSDGGTLLTVITSGGGGRKLYTFRLIPAHGTPQYHTVAVQTGTDLRSPITALPVRGTGSLEDVERGLQVAVRGDFMAEGGDLWERVQNFLSLARSGLNTIEAARQAGISTNLVNKLSEWGAAPGSAPTFVDSPENSSPERSSKEPARFILN